MELTIQLMGGLGLFIAGINMMGDGIEEVIEPTQLDIIEAQVFYTAMCTDTLISTE